jgi:endonuclease G
MALLYRLRAVRLASAGATAAVAGGAAALAHPGSSQCTSASAALSAASDHRAPAFEPYVRAASATVLKYGLPSKDNLKYRDGYCLAYDRRTRNPAWVGEYLTKASLAQKIGKRKDHFLEDPSEPHMFQAKLADYKGSGYDRGHMACAADMKTSQNSMDSTFLLTNMCPQVGDGFNRDYWARFEHFARELTRSYDGVFVFTGPLYMPVKQPNGKWLVAYEMIGPGDNREPNVAVPTHFFKVILGERQGGLALGCFISESGDFCP